MGWRLQIDRSAFRLTVALALVITLVGAFAPRINAAEEISGLQLVVAKYGQYSLSIDGVGIMRTDSTGTIEIEKPVGATVEAAYLITSSMVTSGSTENVSINDGVATPPVLTVPADLGGQNTFADVTDVLSETLNNAPAGTVTLTVTEDQSGDIDGDVLAVIWNDPGQTVNTSIVLAFGALPEDNVSLTLDLVDPVDTSDPNLAATMSLGISFSFPDSSQYTMVDINGERLTSSAGGHDDNQGVYDHYTLLTVGGTGDSTDNPPDPNASPVGAPRYDDELYNLLPFIDDGDAELVVTATPSPFDLDNLFFAGFELVGMQVQPLSVIDIAADQASVTVAEGQTATMTGTFSSTDVNPVSLSASIGAVVDNGDGTWSWSYLTTDGPDEDQTVAITATDSSSTQSVTFDLAVLNVAPSMTAVFGPPGPIEAGVAASFGGTFTDPGTGDTHTATWDWGDGTTSNGAISANSVSGSHTFATAGYFTVKLTLADDDGGSVTTTYSSVTVFDRNAGWLTIAGNFQSPAGAWMERPSVSTAAAIDVLAGYARGDTPTGRLTFTLGGSSRTAPALSLRATGFDVLVMDDDTAWLQGTGTLNGQRGYAFRLTATDGPGVNSNDGVRIRIWEVATGTVVYDTLPAEPQLTAATQPLTRGLVAAGGFSFR